MKHLTIISHTEHYKTSSGEWVGHGATITEINHLLSIFDSVTHIAMKHDKEPPSSALPYSSDRITFIPLPALGGKTFGDKFQLILAAPRILNIVRNALKGSDCFQFRAPTGIGVYVIPYLIFFNTKPGWFKYAGSWNLAHAPIAYRLQRWMLKHQKRKVTINGQWTNQPKQCLSFENPCLTSQDIDEGQLVIQTKTIEHKKLNFCFVGRLEAAKGLGLLIESFKQLHRDAQNNLGTIHIVGEGTAKDRYIQSTIDCGIDFKFHGLLPRNKVHHIYKESHALILPSASEGFPKVLVEAMNYGCVPIVSNVSAISQYINENNGYLLPEITLEGLNVTLNMFMSLTNSKYFDLISGNEKVLEKFTYAFYNIRIQSDILYLK